MNIVVYTAVLLGGLWGSMALWFRSPWGGRARGIPAAVWAVLAVSTLIAFADHPVIAWVFAGVWVVLLYWWFFLVLPSNHRPWMPEVSEQTRGVVDGKRVTLHNLRDFHWRSADDFDARWQSRTYDLSRLESVDLALSYWGRPSIAHAMVSFGFGDGEYAVFSVEIRRKSGDRFSELGGFFRQYELAVLASTEEDSLRVRTNIRGEDGYLFRVKLPDDAAQALFLAYVETANSLCHRPRFYNSLTANCTTLVYQLVDRIIPGLPMDYRLLLSGYLPEYLYGLGALEGADTPDDYRRAGHYTERARSTERAEDFSRNIRRGVPGVMDAAHSG